MKHFYFLISLFSVVSLQAQTEPRKWLEGKIIAEFADLEGIDVINTNAQHSTLSQSGGYFTTWAKPGDTVMFSAVHIKGIMVGLTQADFEKDLYFVRLESMVSHIEEVRVRQYRNITAESLGIVKNVKRYTPAERKLKAASEMTIGTIVTLDPLINWISGRTAMLKKELAIERKERLMEVLESMFDAEYIVGKLKIPESHVRGFLYYAVEDKSLMPIVNSKNMVSIEFKMTELATAYNQTLAGEK